MSRGALFYLVAPVAELWVAIKVGSAWGAGWTILALLALSAFGAFLITSRSASALKATVTEIAQDQNRAGDIVADRGLSLLAALLLVLPGFITAAVGLVLLVKPVRSLLNPVVAGHLPSFSFLGTFQGPGFGFRGDVIDVDATPKADRTNPSERPELR